MNNLRSKIVLAIWGAAALLSVSTAHAQSVPAQISTLQSQVAALQAQVNALQAQLAGVQSNHALLLGPFVNVDPNPEIGVIGPKYHLQRREHSYRQRFWHNQRLYRPWQPDYWLRRRPRLGSFFCRFSGSATSSWRPWRITQPGYRPVAQVQPIRFRRNSCRRVKYNLRGGE